jgi:integrase
MAKIIGRLSALAVAHAHKPGMLADGQGLYLQVGRSNARSWIFRYFRNGKSHEMGLGPLTAVGLASARAKAAECRALLAEGIDPIAARNAERTRQDLAVACRMTFDECASAYIKAHSSAWKNHKHVAQWTSTLRTYVSPVFGALPVQAVDVGLVMKVLEPIWTTKPETASRIRGRIESVLNWARARGYRGGENPARWKGHLDNLLPARSKIAKVKHHAALPYYQISEFMTDLRAQDGIAALALEFAILTAARTGEIIGARWNEIDLEEKVWTVPAERMKADREHRVPLSTAALAVLNRVGGGNQEDFIFASPKKRPLSNMALLMLLRRMGYEKVSVHGFRSTFRDWVAERTNFQAEVAEAALGHMAGDKVELAYRRGDFFEKRRRLMQAWAQFISEEPDTNVVLPLRGNVP